VLKHAVSSDCNVFSYPPVCCSVVLYYDAMQFITENRYARLYVLFLFIIYLFFNIFHQK